MSLSRALARLQAGQNLQDLSFSCLVAIEEHFRVTAHPLAGAALAELRNRL